MSSRTISTNNRPVLRSLALACAAMFSAGLLATAAEAGGNKRNRTSGDGMMRLGGPSNGNGRAMRLGGPNGNGNTSGFQGFSGNDSGALGSNQRVRDFFLNNPSNQGGGQQ